MSSRRDWFQTFTPLTKPTQIILGDTGSIPATGTGSILARFPAKGKWHRIVLHNVLCVPELHGNLLSVPQISKRGVAVRFKGDNCQIFSDSDTLIGEASSQGNLYTLGAEIINPRNARNVSPATSPNKGNNLPESALTAKTSSV